MSHIARINTETKMSKIEILKIDNIAYGGDGAGRLTDGRVCFVPFSIPGETVKVEIIKESKTFAGLK